MFCPHCGSENSNDAVFCGRCGKLLHNDRFDDESIEQDDVEREKFDGKEDPFDEEYDIYGSTPEGGVKEFAKTHRTGVIIGAIVLGVLLIILIASIASKPKKEERVHATPHVSESTDTQTNNAAEIEEKAVAAEPAATTEAPAPKAEIKPVAKKEAPAPKIETVEVVEAQSTRSAVEREGLTPLDVQEVHAASWLDEGKYKHYPENMIDGDPKTAWCSARGDELTTSFELYLPNSTPTLGVRGIAIDGGYQKSEKLYYQNARPRTIQVTTRGVNDWEGGTGDAEERVFEITLDDEMTPQILYFPETVPCNYIKVNMIDVYAGSKYSDICISEITVFQ